MTVNYFIQGGTRARKSGITIHIN